MALGRNHRIFNIGNSSGSYGISRVYHDSTLSGDGTLSSLLGVVGGGQDDEEVNQFVYDNSATIDEVNTSYQTNSGNFLTAIPDYYATTGDINDLAQSISENYQVKGDYAERDFVLSSIESSTSGKLDTSSFASVSSDFLTTSFGISESATWNETTEVVQTNSAQWADGGSGDEEVNSFVYNNSATINEVNTAYQTHSASYQPSGNYIPYTGYSASLGYVTNSSFTIHNGSFTNTLGRSTIVIQNRISSNIYSNMVAGPASISFSTQSDSAKVDLPSINKWNDVSTTVQSNSAQWSENTGDEEVNNAVYNNSAKWNDISVYQSNSSTYLTAHQDISNKLDTNSFTAWSAAQAANAFKLSAGNGINLIDDSINKITRIDVTAGAGDIGVNTYVRNNSAGINNAVSTYQSNSAKYLTAHQNISNKLDITAFRSWTATQEANDYELSAGNGVTLYDDTVNKITRIDVTATGGDEEVNTLVQTNSSNWNDISAYQNVSSTYLTAVDLTPYQTIEGMTAYQPAGDYATTNELEQVSADITANIPSTAGLASESYVQTNSAVLTGMIDGKQDTLTFGYDEQDRINSINSSALAGGGDVPEDVMVESAIGYNAVGEISGYGNSAIAQYGAEKQWLVHDDTLVHAANSAQYALGVNLSAVAQLLGVDETVLWTGGLTSTLSLSEPMSSFNKVRFVMHCDNSNIQVNQNLIHEVVWSNGNIITMADVVRYPDNTTFPVYDYRWGANIASNGKDISNVYHEMYWHAKDSWQGGGLNEKAAYYPIKIIGIGRKQ